MEKTKKVNKLFNQAKYLCNVFVITLRVLSTKSEDKEDKEYIKNIVKRIIEQSNKLSNCDLMAFGEIQAIIGGIMKYPANDEMYKLAEDLSFDMDSILEDILGYEAHIIGNRIYRVNDNFIYSPFREINSEV